MKPEELNKLSQLLQQVAADERQRLYQEVENGIQNAVRRAVNEIAESEIRHVVRQYAERKLSIHIKVQNE